MARTKSDAPRARGRGRGLKRPARALAKGETVTERAATELEEAWNGKAKMGTTTQNKIFGWMEDL